VLRTEGAWAIIAAIALIASAAWLATPGIGYLAVAFAATVAVAAVAIRAPWASRRWPLATTATLAVFITMALVGVTSKWYLMVGGGIGIVWVLIRWIADTRRDVGELPLHHGEH